ncbi:hypothetical protein TNCV_1771581 [Trichonephila clavipes]|nr:hypothetical protein TNCV_1771581 [Trichonephila clavipes]
MSNETPQVFNGIQIWRVHQLEKNDKSSPIAKSSPSNVLLEFHIMYTLQQVRTIHSTACVTWRFAVKRPSMCARGVL